MVAAGSTDAARIAAIETNTSWTCGTLGYLVSTTWWNAWVQHSGYTGPSAAPAATLLQQPGGGGPRPGPISNADLLPAGHTASDPPLTGTDSTKPLPRPEGVPLCPGLVEQHDFVVVSEASWRHLHSLYGGGPAIARRVVADAAPGPSGQPCDRWHRVDLYPLRLEVSYKDKDGKEKSTVVSIEAEATLAALKERACAALGVSEAEVSLWDYSGGSLVQCLEAPPAGGETAAEGDAINNNGSSRNNLSNPHPTTINKLTAAAGNASAEGGGGGGGGVSSTADPAAATAPEAIAAAITTSTVMEESAAAAAASSAMDLDGAPAGATGASGASVTAAAAAGSAGGGGSGSGGSCMDRTLRDVALQDQQLLLLRRKDARDSDSDDDDACGSDNDTGVPASRKSAGRKVGSASGAAAAAAAKVPAVEAAGAAAMRRASGSGAASRSDGGGGGGAAAAAAPPSRTSGGGAAGSTLGSGSRLGQRSSLGAWDDNVMLREGQAPGLAGLSNLGNTCFMNSSLQCLAHAVPLMASFLGGAYLQDLNRSNPLGMKGELAESFGSLMGQLWRGGVSAVTPRAFKAKIGRFAPQFSGYAQHDSQEFLAFLLDGLHEDTNRIKDKPYIEEKDLSGRPDEEVAAEAWANYRARNNSLVVDHFQGLFKSTVDCPKCRFNSVKFDPFMYLSLPLPESRRRLVEVVLVRTDGSELPCRMMLDLASGAAVVDLLRGAAETAGLPAEVAASPEAHLLAARPLRPSPTANSDEIVLLSDPRMRLADAMDSGSSTSSYSLRSSASSQDHGLVVYYYPDAAQGPTAQGLAPVIVHFKRHDPRRATSWSRGVWCGAPLVLYMPEDQPPYDPAQVVRLPAGPGTNTSRTEYDISGACALSVVLETVLRPIQRYALPQPQPPPAAAEAAAEAAVQPVAAAAAAAGACPTSAAPSTMEDALPPVESAVAVAAAAAAAAAAQPVGPMEEDDPPAGPSSSAPITAAAAGPAVQSPADERRPLTPTREEDRDAAIATGTTSTAAASAAASPGRRSSSGGAAAAADSAGGGELMEGLEPLVSAEEPDTSMPGTPQPTASAGPMEDDVAAAPATLPAVILAGPSGGAEGPPGAGASGGGGGEAEVGPPQVQPFDMWAAQDTQPAAASRPAAGPPAPGPPFILKLCSSKGDSILWGISFEKEINREHHREFLLFFSEACSTAAAAAAPHNGAATSAGPAAAAAPAAAVGPYAADLLDTPSEHPSLQEHRRRSAAGPQPVGLYECMNTFLQPERLAESDAWYCPRCKSHVCADKKLDLWSLPEVLVVHLKRFSYTRYSRTKLDTRVDFPLHGLDLGSYVMRQQAVQPVYDLFAVSNHYGSLGGGHYTAYAKLPSPPPRASSEAGAEVRESWYCFDDSHVSAVEPAAVLSPAAYVLFYRRRAESSADPPRLDDLLTLLREQRAAITVAAAQLVDGPAQDGAGSPDSGRDRRPDQDQDQGRPYGASRAGSGAAGAAVSIAAAAEAARAARHGDADQGGDADEDLQVTGRSLTAFTAARRDSGMGGAYGNRTTGGSDLYGDGGAAVAGPSSPTPMSVGNTVGVGGGSGSRCTAQRPSQYDDVLPYGGGGSDAAYAPEDFDAFSLGRGVQPPGSPVALEPDLHHNVDLSLLYQDVEDMEVARERHSGSDMVSAGGNDHDDDDDVHDVADAWDGRRRGSSSAGGHEITALGSGAEDEHDPGPERGLMSTSPM